MNGATKRVGRKNNKFATTCSHGEVFFSVIFALRLFFEKSYPTIHPSGNLKHTHTHTLKRKTNQPTKPTPYKFEGKCNLLIQRFEGL